MNKVCVRNVVIGEGMPKICAPAVGRSREEILPWDFLDVGVSKAFLLKEWDKSQEEQVTPNCRQACQGCGAGKYRTGVCKENREEISCENTN